MTESSSARQSYSITELLKCRTASSLHNISNTKNDTLKEEKKHPLVSKDDGLPAVRKVKQEHEMMACLKRIDTVASGDTADATSPTPPQTTKGSSKNTQMVIGVSCTSSSRTSPCSSSRDTSDHELSGRKKRPRTAFTLNQIKQLESEFENCKYLSVSKRTQLSSSLGLSETQGHILIGYRPYDHSNKRISQIKIWFQNRRTKWKRKFTSDLESMAHQYYTSLGLHEARPMVIGDRLWLFNSMSPVGAITSSQLLPPQSLPQEISSSTGHPTYI